MSLAASNLSLQGFHPSPAIIVLVLVLGLYFYGKRSGVPVWFSVVTLLVGIMVAVAFPAVAVDVSSFMAKI